MAGNDHDISRALGLPRPLDSYAPRTQRRYRAAYREGLTRSDVTRREREQRGSSPAGLAAQIRRVGIRTPEHEPDGIRRLVAAVGSERAREILSDQLASARDYKENKNPSRGRAGLRHLDAEIRGEEIIDLKPYTYYRAS